MTPAEVDILVAKCCCWFNISMAKRHDDERKAIRDLLARLDFKKAHAALFKQSIRGAHDSFALNITAIFSTLNILETERLVWEGELERRKERGR